MAGHPVVGQQRRPFGATTKRHHVPKSHSLAGLFGLFWGRVREWDWLGLSRLPSSGWASRTGSLIGQVWQRLSALPSSTITGPPPLTQHDIMCQGKNCSGKQISIDVGDAVRRATTKGREGETLVGTCTYSSISMEDRYLPNASYMPAGFGEDKKESTVEEDIRRAFRLPRTGCVGQEQVPAQSLTDFRRRQRPSVQINATDVNPARHPASS